MLLFNISNHRSAIIIASTTRNYMHPITTQSNLSCPSARQASANSTTAEPLSTPGGKTKGRGSCWPQRETGSSQRSSPQMQPAPASNPSRGVPLGRAPITGHRCLGVPLVVLRRSAAQRPLRTAAEGEACRGGFKMGGAKLAKSVKRPERWRGKRRENKSWGSLAGNSIKRASDCRGVTCIDAAAMRRRKVLA